MKLIIKFMSMNMKKMTTKEFFQRVLTEGTENLDPQLVELNREEGQAYLDSLRLIDKFRIQERIADKIRAFTPGWKRINEIM